MKILLLSSFLPYPLHSGGHVRLYNLIQELSKTHDITLVCEKRNYQTESDRKEVEKICKEVFCVERKRQWSVLNIFRTGFSPYPFLMIGHTQSKLNEILFELISKNSFDLIHVETFYVFQNLPKTEIPTVLVEHNVEYMVYQRYSQKAPLFLKPALYVDILKMKYWEEKFWKKANKVVAVSEYEKKIIGRDDTIVIPNGVDIEKFTLKKNIEKKKKILFIGDFKWVKNTDALGWILRKIWPLFLQRQSDKRDSELWVIGKHISKKLKELMDTMQNVVYDENASERTEEIFQQAYLLLAPIRVGGGTSFKILEAMASGTPVITTSIGIEGLTLEKNKEIVVADSEEETVLALDELLTDEKKYKKIAISARALIEREYNWPTIANKLNDVYKSVI